MSVLDELRQAVAKELESLNGVVALRQDGLNVAPYVYRHGDDTAAIGRHASLSSGSDRGFDTGCAPGSARRHSGIGLRSARAEGTGELAPG